MKSKITNPFSGLVSFFKNRQFQQIFGLFMILISAIFAISFTSYLLTWKIDDSLFNKTFLEILSNDSPRVANIMGKLGAALSNVFIRQWFGVASYFFVIFLFVAGIRLVWPQSKAPVWRTFKLSLLGLVWFSTAFAFFLPNKMNGLLHGWFGYFANSWLITTIGTPGTLLILLFIFVSFLIIIGFFKLFNFGLPSFSLKGKKSSSKSKNSKKKAPKEDIYNTREYSLDDDDEDLKDDMDDPSTEFPLETEYPTEENTEKKKSTNADGVKDIDFTIEGNNEPEERVNIPQPLLPSQEEKPVVRGGLETNYDPRLDLPTFQFPGLDLLNEYGDSKLHVKQEELENNKNRIVKTLNNYKIDIDKIKATIGPTVTLYEIVPAPGVRISKIKNLEDDIALSLAALGIRIIAPIPGKGTIGIEVPNSKPDIVSMKSVLASEKFKNTKYELPFGMGKTIANEDYVADLTKMPHILMAGATGQGKSVGLNAIIASILYKKHPAELKFVMVDPKKVELTLFSKIERHYLAKLPDSEEAIITDTRKVVRTLNSLGIEMDTRYELLKDAHVKNIKEYNSKFLERKLDPNQGHHFMPYIVLVIDEFADLIMTAGKEIELPLTRLAQLARAVGIHLIIATQRPSVNIITGSIKANFPARVAFRVIAKVDSRTILDSPGADQLIGRGDMLLSTGSDLIRLQCAFIDTPEIEKITDFIGAQRAYPNAYHLPEFADEQAELVPEFDANERDTLFEDAARIIVQNQQGSTSLLQRKMKIGYNRAGRIVDQLEAAGIVGSFEGSKAREVLIKTEYELEQFLKDMDSDELI